MFDIMNEIDNCPVSIKVLKFKVKSHMKVMTFIMIFVGVHGVRKL